MTDLNNNPTLNNTEPTNSEIAQTNELNFNPWEVNQSEQENFDAPENSSDNIADNNINTFEENPFTLNEDKSVMSEVTDTSEVDSAKELSQGPNILESSQESSPENSKLEDNNQTSENLYNIPMSENTENILVSTENQNNEVVLETHESSITNNSDTLNASQQIDNSTLGYSANLDISPIEETKTEDLQKNKSSQKEKLLQLIKTHESKAQKKWFLTWILSGIIATIWIVTITWFLAKDQIIDLLNSINWNYSLTANIINITNNDEENLNEENLNEENLNEENLNEESTIEDYENTEDINSEEDSTNDFEYNENNYEENNYENTEYNPEFEENINNDIQEFLSENNEEVNEEKNENIILNEEYDNISNELYTEEWNNIQENDNWYHITHVNSEEEANWVLPAHCSDLTCYGEDKEFTPCNRFKMDNNLDENAHRIGKNW